jgi:hypothetical protein
MKTLLLKINVLAKALSFTLLLAVFSAASFATENQTNVADSGSNKYNVAKSENSASVNKLATTEKKETNSEKELNAITIQISESIKFHATPLDFDGLTNDNNSDLNIIMEEVAKSVKFQPTVIL